MEKLFGTDGIRGQANRHPITPELVLQLGKALGQVSGGGGRGWHRAVIGKDTRLSGYMLETALTSGLVSMGMDVFLVGPIPTPAVAHLTKSMAADVGVVLTASHNPYDDNGIKLFGRDGFKLPDAVEDRISRATLSRELLSGHIRSDKIGKAYRIDDARGRYIEFVKHTIDSQDLSGLKVVMDCANGAAYFIAPIIVRELGASVIKASVEPDGYNINNNCGALHPEAVAKLVRLHGADVGIAFDGDADRVIFCDARGKVVDGDRILAMCAIDFKERDLLARNMLVVTSMSNLGLHEAMAGHGITVEATDVGDRYVIERMRKTGANLGGEKSGHVIFMDHATTGDGIIAALQVLKLMKQKNATLAELSACMKEYPQVMTGLDVSRKKPIEDMPRLQEVMARCRDALGTDGRIIVRYSGTENKLRILVEAKAKADAMVWTRRLVTAAHKEIEK